MLTIGLTGPTGAGKSVFGAVAAEKFGALHIDTDKTAREVVEKGKPCLEEIAEYFGKDVIRDDGSLDRKALGKIVFSDAEKLKKLNEITHYYIKKETQKTLDEAKKNGIGIAVVDAPLLFESGTDKMCDVTVGVIAERTRRRSRIIERDAITDEAAALRMGSEKSADFFKERCDYILTNDSSMSDFEEKSAALIENLVRTKA